MSSIKIPFQKNIIMIRMHTNFHIADEGLAASGLAAGRALVHGTP